MTSEYIFKFAVLGDQETGKTSILKRYLKDDFYEIIEPTIGVDFTPMTLNFSSETLMPSGSPT